jgi:hypothetical protein
LAISSADTSFFASFPLSFTRDAKFTSLK